MNWSRAKTILILSFLGLNVLLGYQLWVTRIDQLYAAIGTASVVEELDKLLESKNIRIEGEIPKDIPELKGFTIEYDERFHPDTVITLSEPFKWSAVPNKNPNREQFLKQYIEKADEYQLDPVTREKGLHTFMQMHGSLPMFDVKLELMESNGYIMAYRQEYVIVNYGEEQKDSAQQKVIPAYTAIRTLVENYLEDGTTIVDIRLGYYNSKTKFMFPSWRIVTANGDQYFFNAFNGAVEVSGKPSG